MKVARHFAKPIALLALLQAAPASAVVIVETGINVGFQLTDPVAAVSQQGPLLRDLFAVRDFAADAARAEADAARGLLRVFARDGGTSRTPAAGGKASIDETVVFTGPPGSGGLATFSLLADANIDTLSITTGGPIGGSTFASFDAQARVTALLPGGDVFGRGSMLHQSGHQFRQNSAGQIEVTPNGPSLQTTPFIQDRGPLFPNPVQDVRFDVIANAISTVEVLIELDFLVNPGDRFRLYSEVRAQSAGAPGHGAAVNALNTALLGLALPEGLGFTSESGVFLSLSDTVTPITPTPPVAPIPLPATAALLAAALMALGWRGLGRARLAA